MRHEPSTTDVDIDYMHHAIALAKLGWGETHPNPIVGAVLVQEGIIVGEGYHQRAGGPHAEIHALREAGDAAQGATLYVTLEPCCTHGRTPPCCAAIIEAGVSRVVIGARDPNPLHAGRGDEILREAGLEVINGVLEKECDDLNLIFNHWIVHRTPLIAAKIATTLDGYIATRSGDSRWITGELSREDVHRWRKYFPAIAVGAGTVRSDNPLLTTRLPEAEVTCPTRFVFDRRLQTVIDPLPLLYSDAFKERTIVVTQADAPAAATKRLEQQGVEVWRLPAGSDEALFAAFREECSARAITGMIIEGGSRLLSALLAAKQIDYLFAYRAPILMADAMALPAMGGSGVELLQQAWRLADVRHESFGPDQLMRGWLSRGI